MTVAFRPINWRLLLLHFLAIPFLIMGAQQLERSQCIPLVLAYQQDPTALQKADPEMLSIMLSGPLYAWAYSLVGACLLSAVVVWRRQESALVPFLLLGLAKVSSYTYYYESTSAFQVLALLRGFLHAWSVPMRFRLVGGALVLLGLLPFVYTWRRRLIRF